ncbi:MAG: hypothetical protein N4A74_15730 [Carboxylicivirga sp.]|jgi:hypothetical protein|nr:hypothetical protein [Carboxylicivirga sp.]
MNSEQILNQEAYELGKLVKGTDRVLIQNKLHVTESTVNVVLTGKRKATRGKSLQIVKMAKRIAEINQVKKDLI